MNQIGQLQSQKLRTLLQNGVNLNDEINKIPEIQFVAADDELLLQNDNEGLVIENFLYDDYFNQWEQMKKKHHNELNEIYNAEY